jgi:hypothetical protein
MSERLQHKLYNYEVNPPGKVWEKIASSLDESHLSESFPAKLYNLEANPPAGVWEKIESTLAGESEIVIPVRRQFYRIRRYAIAAILIGIVALGSLWIINNSGKNEMLTIETAPEKNDSLNKDSENVTVSESVEDKLQKERDDAALEASKQTFAKLDVSSRKRIMAVNPEFLALPIETSRNNEQNPEETYRNIFYSSINSSVHLDTEKYNVTDRYIMLMTPEGHIIRMAKKWGDLVCCVAGEDPDEVCTDQLKKWRDKLANAPIAPSPGNFLDILSLVNLLREN